MKHDYNQRLSYAFEPNFGGVSLYLTFQFWSRLKNGGTVFGIYKIKLEHESFKNGVES